MMYFKIDAHTFIQYDEVGGGLSVILKSDLIAQQEKLKNVPPAPDNATLLAWAKINYPGIENMGRDKDKIAELNDLIAKLNVTI